MPTPWHDDDFVYFELSTPEFVAFEPRGGGHFGRVSRYSAWAGWPSVSNAVGRSARA
jgi:hypothetical protein